MISRAGSIHLNWWMNASMTILSLMRQQEVVAGGWFGYFKKRLILIFCGQDEQTERRILSYAT
jgi:hypothetical protein